MTKEQSSITEALTKGLQAGFAGKTEKESTVRAGVAMNVLRSADDTYDDRYTDSRSGGGQEIVREGDEAFTRLYAGGTLEEQALADLGVTYKEVMGYLKKVITEDGENIRLRNHFQREDGEWRYQYEIVGEEPSLDLTMGKESIFFTDTRVFVHGFLLSPVR